MPFDLSPGLLLTSYLSLMPVQNHRYDRRCGVAHVPTWRKVMPTAAINMNAGIWRAKLFEHTHVGAQLITTVAALRWCSFRYQSTEW